MTKILEKPFREISVVFPAYNEEDNLPETFDRALDTLDELFENFEVIVVDDASTDRTVALLEDYAGRHPQIKVLQNEQNQGAGASMLRGMREAQCELVINNAMDYPFDLRDLDKMCPQLEQAEADVVVAARTGRPGYTFYRRLLSWFNRMLLRAMFRLPFTDCNFVQLYRRKVVQEETFDSRSAGFLPAEMLIRARDRGYRATEVKIPYHPRTAGTSVMGHPRVVWNSFREMLSFWGGRFRSRIGRLAASKPRAL
jgi:glycosyltransferase involved in cell wall biosynthesis